MNGNLSAEAGEFKFVVVSDLHYMTADNRPWLDGLVQRINSTPGIELALVLGDLAENGAAEELTAAREILRGLSMPWYCVPGNHDGPPERPVGSGAAGLTEYERLFPHRRNYTFTHKGWQFVALDTTDGSGYQGYPCPAEAREFARQAARTLDRQRPTILFTHMPLFPAVRFSLGDGLDLVDLFRPLNLRIVFSGHFHGATDNPVPNRPEVHLITGRCCSPTRELHDGTTQRGYMECRARADGVVEHVLIEYRGVI